MKGLFFVLSTVIFCSVNAFAAHEFVTCSTDASGLQFSRSERDPQLARNLTTQDCANNQTTNNEECNANLWCDDQYASAPAMLTCKTESRGLRFDHESRDPRLARQLAINACTNSQGTDNNECNANVACNDGSYVPHFVSCQTDSNGLNFNHADRDSNLARQLAITTCSNNQSTDNNECNANIWCSDQGPYPQRFVCSTLSKGQWFRHDGLDRELTKARAVNACTNNQSTNNDECNANIACHR